MAGHPLGLFAHWKTRVRVMALLITFLVAILAASPRAIETLTPWNYQAQIVKPHRGRVLVVNFWATWCEPCREEMPALIAAGRKLAGKGVDVVLVSADFLSERDRNVRSFLDRLRVPFPCFIEDSPDPQTFIERVDPKWGGELPHTVFYGRDGRVRLAVSRAQTEEELSTALERGLREW